MPTTKSIVTFVNTSSEVKKTIEGLSKTALRSSAKVVRKYLRENIPVRSKRFKNHIGSWVMINRQTGQPTLQVGFYSWQKVKAKGKLPSHSSPHWVEFGTNRHTIKPRNKKIMWYEKSFGYLVNHPGQSARHVLRDTVQDHIQDIRAAQEEYLSEITKTLEEAGIKVEAGDEFEDDD